MDLKDCLTPALGLIGEIVHEGRQADASAAQKFDNRSHHVGQYSLGTFKTEG